MSDLQKTESEEVKNDFFLSRIDRSVADNLNDIRMSFGEDAGVVKDFIVFVSKNLKKDLFGFTKFTLQEFCKESGRNRQDLAKKHPYFAHNPKILPPKYSGHEFSSVFDYALFNMLQKNIIFSKAYAINNKDNVVHLENFPILKDIKLNIDRKTNTIKIYEIRISNEWLDGFISRYYTIETNGYPKVGKGRGGDGRKSLYLILQRTRHQLLTQNETKARFSVDYLAELAEITAEENRFRKRGLKRALDFIFEKSDFPFTYKFVSNDSANRYQEDYFVEFDFSVSATIPILSEKRGDHLFLSNLISELKSIFNFKYKDLEIKGEIDSFQRWLVNKDADLDIKIDQIVKSYYSAYNKNITKAKAIKLIKDGLFI